MYQPTIGRWLSRDPIGIQGQAQIGYSHRYVARRLHGQLRPVSPIDPNLNAYAYVDNNPASLTDPGGMQPKRVPIGAKPPQATCRLRVCATSIRRVPGARHLLIVLERKAPRRGNIEWAYRCEPSLKGKEQAHCQKKGKKFGKLGQLVCVNRQYKKGFIDWVPKAKEDCESFEVKIVGRANCETIHRCLQRVLKSIDACCIDYAAVPLRFGSACNSNCAVRWMLDLCFKGGPKLFIKGRKPGFAPGFQVPPPKCLRDKFRGQQEQKDGNKPRPCSSPR